MIGIGITELLTENTTRRNSSSSQVDVTADMDARFTPDLQGVVEAMTDFFNECAEVEAVSKALTTNQYIELTESCSSIEQLAEATITLNEGAVGDFVEKIKEAFKKLWAKMKAIWEKFIAYLGGLFMKHKDFVKKYRKTIEDKSYKGFEYRGHKWDLDALNKDIIKKRYVAIAKEADTKANGIISGRTGSASNENKESFSTEELKKIKNTFRALACGGSGEISEQFFADKLELSFRDKDKSYKGDSPANTIKDMLDTIETGDILSNAKELKKECDDFYKGILDQFDGVKDKVKEDGKGTMSYKDSEGNAVGKSYTSADNGKKMVTAIKGVYSEASSISNVLCGKYITMSKTCIGEFRSILNKMLTFKEEEDK